MKSSEYQCSLCKEVFKAGWTDKEAVKECDEVWGSPPDENFDVVCDDCWNKIHPSKHPLLYAQVYEEHNP